MSNKYVKCSNEVNENANYINDSISKVNSNESINEIINRSINEAKRTRENTNYVDKVKNSDWYIDRINRDVELKRQLLKSHTFYDSKTEVLTCTGVKPIKSVTVDDLLFTMNPDTYKVEYQNPIECYHLEYDGPMYYSNHKTVDFAITPGSKIFCHNFDIKNKEISWQIALIKDTIQKCLVYLTRGLLKPWKGIPIKEEFPQQSTLAFAKAFGAFITDGCLHKSKNCESGYTVLYQQKLKGREFIKNVLSELDWKYTIYSDRFAIHNIELYKFLKKYFPKTPRCIYGRVPYWVRMAPPDYIEAFMEGVIMGDGSIDKNTGQIRIKIISKPLINDYQECALKIGRSSSIYFEQQIGIPTHIGNRKIIHKHNRYNLYIRKGNLARFEQDHWNLEQYKGHVHSVIVPNGLIYTRRNGKCLWTVGL